MSWSAAPGAITHDVEALVDFGYLLGPSVTGSSTDGATENFEPLAALPDGWTIEDNLDNGQVWRVRRPGAHAGT